MPKPLLRYYGGKWRSANWISQYFPPHYTYVEPFGGSAGVLLQKPPATFEVYNDLDSNVVTLFRVLREQPKELIEALHRTPWSREELALSYQPASDDLETARRFYVRCWQSFGHLSGGWRYQHSDNGYSIVEQWNNVDYLNETANRLKKVQIENGDALEVIPRFDTPRTLFYVDPPYVHQTRFDKRVYDHEMTDEQHRTLAQTLHRVRGMVILSGYHSPLYDDLYKGWRTVEKKASNNGNSHNTEVLWLSPNVVSLDKLPLFEALGLTGA